MSEIEQQIKDLETKIAVLRQKKIELDSLTPAQKLADDLHATLCHYNHTDGCGWFYESWGKPGNEHTRYLTQAEKLLSIESNYEKLRKILTTIKGL